MLEISAKNSHDILSYSNTNNDPDTNGGDGYYAEVEKKHKTHKNASVNVNSKNDNILCKKNEESPDIGQLYSVVDKSSDISEMYSVVNKIQQSPEGECTS